LPDVVYFSQGDGTFRDATEASGVAAAERRAKAGKGLGVLVCDLDEDGDLDVYVCNDTTENYLFINDGRGVFREVGQLSGVALDDLGVPNGSMGVDVLDYNGDGRLDLWVANYEREAFALYRNEGQGQYLHASQSCGIGALGGLYVGFGTACFDMDHDGDEDIVVGNGHVIKYPTASPRRQRPLILLHEGGRYRRCDYPCGEYLSSAHEARGLAVGDLDQDGDLDFAVSHLNSPIALLTNETPTSDRHWLQVRLIGVRSPRDAIGARLILHTSQGDRVRQVKGGGSYLSQHAMLVHWGWPADVAVSGLSIRWPSGIEQRLTAVPTDRRLEVIEPIEFE
jgi:hypothetical protein